MNTKEREPSKMEAASAFLSIEELLLVEGQIYLPPASPAARIRGDRFFYIYPSYDVYSVHKKLSVL